MKLHYSKILLFVLPLNILLTLYHVHNKNKSYITPHTPTTTQRMLSECDIKTSIYDNDEDMKSVKENFDRQTSQRFEEYDERMNEKRQKSKEQRDKNVQKIIEKDKLEKELMDKFATLQTDIQNDAIPTCVCKKTLADKTEKFCLNCGLGIGSVAPSIGLLGGPGIYGWKAAALVTAKELAEKAGAAKGAVAGNAHGMKIVLHYLEEFGVDILVPGICEEISSTGNYTNVINFSKLIIQKRGELCGAGATTLGKDMCKTININLGTLKSDGTPGLPDKDAIPKVLNRLVGEATQGAAEVAKQASESATAAITKKQTALIEAGFNNSITSIYASIIAILIIVLIMVIIYLILRYRRKKKMKKKLQYIKLLEE
ncbi:hypothetical protein PFNF135_04381 [Plasmodium falciparum NF135/5.C10]|uniref:Surface antigen n=1 Tax=Plasmodium falciparum NF135/5.C10 TaxID=1036726 RepID=W4IDY4_PLAFA|nr:hypothetical protein PFNF135_04381 [Plasmodium falciparum NF135/5.C10]